MDLAGAHVLVTGASRGIGAAMARRFAEVGARVSVAARSADALAALAAEIGASAFVVDLLDPAAADDLVGRVETKAGPIDVLVNNAGVEGSQWVVNESTQRIRDVVRLNLEAPMVLTRAVLPGMLDRGRGALVYTSSLAGTSVTPSLSVYGATKAGLNSFAAAVRLELRDTSLAVTVVAPGPVDTRMWDVVESTTELEPVLRRMRLLRLIPKATPELIAARTVAAVKSGRRHVRTPRRLILPYWLAESPNRITELLLTGVRVGPRRE